MYNTGLNTACTENFLKAHQSDLFKGGPAALYKMNSTAVNATAAVAVAAVVEVAVEVAVEANGVKNLP